MTRLGVIGWPVAHSRSPAMHNAALAQLGMDGWRYQLLPVPPELFEQTTLALRGAGFLGVNVTIPHKRAALKLSTSTSDAAAQIGAANTLTFGEDGEIAAENTDAPGLLDALGVAVAGMRALVLGAGGSARAAVWALREAGAGEVAVWNRTAGRAEELARELGVSAALRPLPADLLVNCTSVGLIRSASRDGELNQLALTFDAVGEYLHVVDLAYSTSETALLAAARAHGVHSVDGLEVLLAQGARSFELWTGRQAPLAVMRTAARRG